MATPDEIITAAQVIANSQLTAANTAAQNAITASQGYASLTAQQVATTITAVEPVVPSVINGTTIYESQLDKLVDLLTQQLADFYTTYYPLASDAFDEATNWLVNSITNGGTGINAAVEAQIFARGTDRVIAEGTRAQNQIVADFAGRGFTIPPGAMSAKLKELRLSQKQSNNAYARDVAIKQAEIEIDNIRFAVGKAIESRQFAMQAASDYIRALMSAPDAAARIATVDSDVQARMISATADLYRARLSRDELVMKSSLANQGANLSAGQTNVNAFINAIGNRVAAAAAAAKVYGDAASAALSGIVGVASKAEVTNI